MKYEINGMNVDGVEIFTYTIRSDSGKVIYAHPTGYTTKRSAERGATNKMKTIPEPVEVKPVHTAKRKSKGSMKFDFNEDPGHGWLTVNKNVIKRLGIEDKISEHSYQRKNTVYLEEDKDMGTFLKAIAKAGIEAIVTRWHTDRKSKIRGYSSYKPE